MMTVRPVSCPPRVAMINRGYRAPSRNPATLRMHCMSPREEEPVAAKVNLETTVHARLNA